MSIYDKATEEWFSKRPGQESTVEQCDQCGLYYKPSLGHKCKVKAEEKTMTVEEIIATLRILGRTKQYREACEEAICILEKQIEKKAKRGGIYGPSCPSCYKAITEEYLGPYLMHCPFCGQALDWSRDE